MPVASTFTVAGMLSMAQEVMMPSSSTVTATRVLSSFTAPAASAVAEVLSAAVVITARPVFTAPSDTAAVGSVGVV